MDGLFLLVLITSIQLAHYAEPTKASECSKVRNPTEDRVLRYQNPGYSTTVTYALAELVRLRCPAVNFCDIEWYKNGTLDPYPWGLKEALPDLQDNRQLLVFRSPTCDVQGTYICVAYNASANITREIKVKVKAPEDGLSNPSQGPSNTCINKTACLGELVSIDCRFNIDGGFQPIKVFGYWYYKPNASVSWRDALNVDYLVNQNLSHTKYSQASSSQNKSEYINCVSTTRIFINQLEFRVENMDAFGYYQLQFRAGGYQRFVRLQVLPGKCENSVTHNILPVIPIIVGCLVISIIALVVAKCMSLNLKIWIKDRFGDKEENDEKIYDVYISYNSDINEDSIFAIRTLRDHLLNKLGYSVCIADIDIIPGTDLMEEISLALDRSRRFIPVISPHYTMSITASIELDIAMDRFSDVSSRIIPILYQDISEDEIAESKMLKHVIKSCIQWKEARQEKFFKEIQLRMPPRRGHRRDHFADELIMQEVMPDGVIAENEVM